MRRSPREVFLLGATSFSLASDIVELVILTTDETFLQTMRDAVGGARRLWHVPTADKVSDLLVAGQVGIVVLDVTALHEPASGFLSQIKRQFPDLVVVVAGPRETETSLAGLISTGAVYRFIHKPMSPGRAKLFADAAVKKYEEQRLRLATPPTVASTRMSPALWLGVACLALTVVILTTWVRERVLRNPYPADLPVSAPLEGGASVLLARAAAALAANRLAQPTGDNALDLYLQAVAHSPADPAARAGLAEVRERLLARAENALLEERLEEAASAIETTRKAGVDAERIAFLAAQLGKARGQRKSAAAQLRSAEARAGKTGGNDDRLNRALGLAAERVREGRLIEPDGDDARYYLQEAQRLEPTNTATQAVQQELAAALLADARAAIARRDFARAVSLLDAANGIAAPASLDNVVQLLRTTRKQAEADSSSQLLRTGMERLQQDHLIEPAGDSAKYYFLTLRSLNPGDPGVARALEELGVRLLAKARLAFTLQQNDAARSWLDEATAIGHSTADVEALRHEVEAAAERQRLLTDVINAKDLTVLRSVPAVYPRKAELAGTEGWVDLDFTVSADGSVENIEVRSAMPPRVFTPAAVTALSQWRYEPVTRNGVPVAQRARMRMRFVLAK